MDIFYEPLFPPLASNILYAMLCALVGYLWRRVKDSQEKQAALNEGVCTLLFAELRVIYTEARLNGNQITFSRLQDAERDYASYHRLGGNGTGTALINDLRRMEKIEDGFNRLKAEVEKA